MPSKGSDRGAGAGRPMVIGASLKMYFGRARAAAWVRAVRAYCDEHEAVRSGAAEPFVVPSFLALPDAVAATAGSRVSVGAQNLHWADHGAFTGEVSAPELVEHGVTMVEVGHAERRRWFGEDDELIGRKVASALRSGLTPVLCVGEAREADPRKASAECVAAVETMLSAAPHAPAGARLVVAYEPVWAIGRATPASAAHIRAVTGSLRAFLAEDPRWSRADVIYGGSAGPGLLAHIADDVDGLFLGRRVHDPRAFRSVLDEVLEVRRIGR